MKQLDTILKRMRESGIRITNTRKAILSFFLESHSPLSAPEILEKLSKIGINVNKTTVYREIEFLLSENHIEEVILGDAIKRYEKAGVHHHHIMCTECKTVEDIHLDGEDLFIKKQLTKLKKFNTINRHLIEFHGVCNSCA